MVNHLKPIKNKMRLLPCQQDKLTFWERAFNKQCRLLEEIANMEVESVDWQKESSGGILLKKMFLKILQNSQENLRVRVSLLIKLQA